MSIAERYEADLYLGQGETSDTFIFQIARDAVTDGRPLVVFTLTDCDPSGWQMFISIARKLQAVQDLLFPQLRWEIVPVALSPEQVRNSTCRKSQSRKAISVPPPGKRPSASSRPSLTPSLSRK